MQMNSQTVARWALPAGVALLLYATVILAMILAPVPAVADQDPAEETPPAAKVSQPQQEPPGTETERSNQQRRTDQSTPAAAMPARPVKPFKPSETLGADSAVSFPIDI